MSTVSWSSRIRHDSNAFFQEWVQELHEKLALAGLIQTADTGQIDTATATRSAINTLTAGYSIWRFDDTLQSVAPIFFRIDYGTGTSSDFPRAAFTVGTGSNGSGTITGTALTAQRVCLSDTGVSANTNVGRQSYLCHTEGFMGLEWKLYPSNVNIGGGILIARTVDSAGEPTATGAMICWGNSIGSATGRQALRFASPAAAYTVTITAETCALGMNPQAPDNTATDGDVQCALAFTITPRAEPLNQIVGVMSTELNPGGTFRARMVGSAYRTYLTCSQKLGPFGPIAFGETGAMNCAMLWE